jgi:hypothetical protein
VRIFEHDEMQGAPYLREALERCGKVAYNSHHNHMRPVRNRTYELDD